MSAVAAIVASLAVDWGIELEPVGRRGFRFAVATDRGRPPATPIVLDLHSEDAMTWLVAATAAGAEAGADAVSLAAFGLAEAVWMIDPDHAATRWVIRLQPSEHAYAMVTREE